jgi:hypothetical protein
MEAVRLIVERRRRENLPNIRLKTRIGLPTTGNGKRRLSKMAVFAGALATVSAIVAQYEAAASNQVLSPSKDMLEPANPASLAHDRQAYLHRPLSLALWRKAMPSGSCPLPDAVGTGTKTCWHFGNCGYSLILFNRRFRLCSFSRSAIARRRGAMLNPRRRR